MGQGFDQTSNLPRRMTRYLDRQNSAGQNARNQTGQEDPNRDTPSHSALARHRRLRHLRPEWRGGIEENPFNAHPAQAMASIGFDLGGMIARSRSRRWNCVHDAAIFRCLAPVPRLP